MLKKILAETNTYPDDVIIGQALTAGQGIPSFFLEAASEILF